MKATVQEICERELAQGRPTPTFFIELIDKESSKCYGTRSIDASEVLRESDRFIGFYGARERVFTESFEIQRGHKIVVVKVSKKRPLICTEHIYPEI